MARRLQNRRNASRVRDEDFRALEERLERNIAAFAMRSHSSKAFKRRNDLPQQPTTSFLALPSEIRNIVYEDLFAGSQTRIATSGGNSKHARTKQRSDFELPALLLTSKQIREEAIGVFFANTTVVASETQRLIQRLLKLDLKYRTLIKFVLLEVTMCDEHNLSHRRLQLNWERKLGYMKAILKQADLQMAGCDVQVRIVSQGSKRMLWPEECKAICEGNMSWLQRLLNGPTSGDLL